MNILFVNENSTCVGGAETHIKYLADALHRLGDHVYLLAAEKEEHAEEILPEDHVILTRHHRNPLKRIRNRSAERVVARTIKEYNIDVVHAHNIFSSISPYFLKKCAVPTVMTLHDYHLICPKTIMFDRKNTAPCSAVGNPKDCCLKRFPGCMKYLHERAMRNRWKRYLGATSFIAPSRYLEKTMRDFGVTDPAGSAPRTLHHGQHITTIHNGVPAMRKDNEYGSASSGEDDNKFHVLFTGRLYPEKGIVPLLNGFKRFLDNRKTSERGPGRIRLTITGDGGLRGTVKEYASGCKEISYLGFVSRDRLKREMVLTDYHITPSLWPENCSIAVLEAMSLGKPCIVSDMGGNPELVRDGKEGYILDFSSTFSVQKKADAEKQITKNIAKGLERAYSERDERSIKAGKCRKRIADEFSSDIMAKKIRKKYMSLTERK